MQLIFRSNPFIYNVTILRRRVMIAEVSSKARRSDDCYYLVLLGDFILKISVIISLTATPFLCTKCFTLCRY